MGFLQKAKKIKRTRKRKRSNSISECEIPPLLTIKLISVKEELPPETRETILTWEPEQGHNVLPAHIARDHIIYDKEVFGYNRITYWAHLEIK